MNLHAMLRARAAAGRPVTVGLIAIAFGMRRSRRPLPKKRSDTTA